MDLDLELVEKTWERLDYELGGGKVQATGYRLWVLTRPYERKSRGGIWLSPKRQGFHGELPHLVTTHALVLSAGPKGVATQFQPGEAVAFKRLHFGYMWKLDTPEDLRDSWGYDEEYVGFIDANDILWKVESDEPQHSQHAPALAAAAG